MAADTLVLLAQSIKAALQTIPGLTVYAYERSDLDRLPAATIDGPEEVQRRGPEEHESELGARDLLTRWTVRLYTNRGDDQAADADAARTLLAQAIDAVDANRGLFGTAEDAGLVTASFGIETKGGDTNPRELTVYTCELAVLTFVL